MACLVASGAAALCVASAAVRGIDDHKRSTYGTGLALVAPAALRVGGDTDNVFVWQAWRLRYWAGFGGGLCMAGLALKALGWLWWRAWLPVAARHFAWHLVPSVAFAALGWSSVAPRPFAWQAWRL